MAGRSAPATRLAWSAEEERARLEQVSEWYDSRVGLNREVIKAAGARILSRARGRRALELGCANGVMTEELAGFFAELDVVEAAARYAEQARRLVPPRGHVYQCLFEEFEPRGTYDTIVMTWVLEHVADPRTLLSRARAWLTPRGEIHLVVPNAESLHRRVGVSMGLLHRIDELNSSDLAIGHRRVYTRDTLAAEVATARLEVIAMEGILLKPLPSALMETWPCELQEAFLRLGEALPQISAEIYAVCHRSEDGNTKGPADRVR